MRHPSSYMVLGFWSLVCLAPGTQQAFALEPASAPAQPASPPLNMSTQGGITGTNNGFGSNGSEPPPITSSPPVNMSTQGGFGAQNQQAQMGGFDQAFGMKGASDNAPIPGKLYQVPAPYVNHPRGSVIQWGRFRYQIGLNGTMTAYGPAPGARYKIPPEYATYPPGSIIEWNRYRYELGADGTMTSSGPVSGRTYQIPPEYASYPVGSVVKWGRFYYRIKSDGMTPHDGPATQERVVERNLIAKEGSPAVDDSLNVTPPNGPKPGERYSVPASLEGTSAGTLIKYEGYQYVINADGTMTAVLSSK